MDPQLTMLPDIKFQHPNGRAPTILRRLAKHRGQSQQHVLGVDTVQGAGQLGQSDRGLGSGFVATHEIRKFVPGGHQQGLVRIGGGQTIEVTHGADGFVHGGGLRVPGLWHLLKDDFELWCLGIVMGQDFGGEGVEDFGGEGAAIIHKAFNGGKGVGARWKIPDMAQGGARTVRFGGHERTWIKIVASVLNGVPPVCQLTPGDLLKRKSPAQPRNPFYRQGIIITFTFSLLLLMYENTRATCILLTV